MVDLWTQPMEALMVPLASLVVPILVSAVIIFFVSFVLWSVLPFWHRVDWSRVDGEDELMNAIRKVGLGRGQYVFPRAASQSAKTWSEDDARKVREGPMASLVIFPPGPPQMGKSLALWFVYLLIIGWVVAYLASRTVAPGVEYLAVFRVTGTAAFLAYAGAAPVSAIWFGHSWSSTVKSVIDGLIYALLTAGVFGWLWPIV
jgi:hypothetical protein